MDVYIEIAEAIKKDVSEILKGALSGLNDRYIYRVSTGAEFTRWGLVKEDIDAAIDRHLIANEAATE